MYENKHVHNYANIYMGNIEGKIILILQEEISLYIFIKKAYLRIDIIT
jgi:hypothetical protein